MDFVEILQVIVSLFFIISELFIIGLIMKMYRNVSKHNDEISTLKEQMDYFKENLM